MNLGTTLKVIRQIRYPKKGYSQVDAANKLKISNVMLSLIENNKNHPSHKLLIRMAKLYSTPIWLIYLLAHEPEDLHKKKIDVYGHFKKKVLRMAFEMAGPQEYSVTKLKKNAHKNTPPHLELKAMYTKALKTLEKENFKKVKQLTHK